MTTTIQDNINILLKGKQPYTTWRSTLRVLCAHQLTWKAVHSLRKGVGGDGIFKDNFDKKYWRYRKCDKQCDKGHPDSNCKKRKDKPISIVKNPAVSVIGIATMPSVPVD